MQKTLKLKWIIWFFLTITAATNAQACSYPKSPSFAESFKTAANIFVFQLTATKLIHKTDGTAFSEWIEGDLRPVMDLKGVSSSYKTITFSSHFCGGLVLNTGHYFLLVTSDKGPEINLRPDDQSILDVTDHFRENRPEANENSSILNAIKRALAGDMAPEKIRTEPYTTSITPPFILPE